MTSYNAGLKNFSCAKRGLNFNDKILDKSKQKAFADDKMHCPPKVPLHTVFQKLFSFSYLKQKLNIISIDLLYTLHHHFNLPINKQYQK